MGLDFRFGGGQQSCREECLQTKQRANVVVCKQADLEMGSMIPYISGGLTKTT